MTRLRPGGEVSGDLGFADGAFAEYVCVPDDRVAPKPANLTFEQAAAVPLAASTALVGLRDLGRVQPGQQVLINGASGGVGTFAIQIAKALGAEVTGVCSTRNVDLARSLGADHVIDYTREDFTHDAGRYGVVFDLVGNRSLTELRRALTPHRDAAAVRWGRVHRRQPHRAVRPRAQGAGAGTLRPPPARHDDRGAAYQGAPGGPEGAHRVRQGHPDH